MKTLKINTKPTHHVNYSDWESFVAKEYKVKNYQIACAEEMGNDTAFMSNVHKTELVLYEVDKLNKFVASNGGTRWITHLLLQDLVNRDKIPEGTYVIKISW